ncbi:MAG: hypothetical protein ACOYON_10455 [Fimbriimonas sp.]
MGTPESWLDVLLLPGVLVFIGALIWIGTWLGDREFPSPNKWRWTALVPLGFAFYLGCQLMWAMHNPDTGFFYRESMRQGARISRRLVLAHYAGFAIPLVALIVVFLWASVDKKRRSQNQDY